MRVCLFIRSEAFGFARGLKGEGGSIVEAGDEEEDEDEDNEDNDPAK